MTEAFLFADFVVNYGFICKFWFVRFDSILHVE